MAAHAAAAILAETATLLRNVNKDDVDTDPFASDEEFEDDKTILDDESQNSRTPITLLPTRLYTNTGFS